MSITERPTPEMVDPDPYTILMAWMAAASLILQFVQTVKPVSNDHVSLLPGNEGRRGALSGLEGELRNLQTNLKGLKRTISRAAKDPDKEFYDSKFKIGIAILKIEFGSHTEYRTNLAQSYARISNISLWINQIIATDPDLASAIGIALLGNLDDSTKKLNSLVSSDASNRAIMFEAQRVIDACEMIVGKMLDGN